MISGAKHDLLDNKSDDQDKKPVEEISELPVTEPKSKSEEKKIKKSVKNKTLYVEVNSPDQNQDDALDPDKPKKVTLKLHHLHDLLDSQNDPLRDSQGNDVENAVISGQLPIVLCVAHEITNHRKKDEVTEGQGKDAFHLEGKEKPSEFAGLTPAEKNQILLDRQNALESQGGESKKKRNFMQ